MDKLVPICTGDYGFNSRTTMIKREHRCLLEEAQKKHWLCDFWAYVFYDVVYNRHTYQNEYYLLGNKPTTQKVDTYLYNALKKLQGKYEVACRRRTRKSKSGKKFIELNLGVNYMSSHSRKRQMTTYGELSIYIDDSYIFIRLLPYRDKTARYSLYEYLTVEKIINDLCAELFSSSIKEISDFQNYRKKLEKDVKSMNLRAIEIARASIKSIYLKSEEENKNIFCGYLYSHLKIGEKTETIIHKDFLENPQLLVSKLQKK